MPYPLWPTLWLDIAIEPAVQSQPCRILAIVPGRLAGCRRVQTPWSSLAISAELKSLVCLYFYATMCIARHNQKAEPSQQFGNTAAVTEFQDGKMPNRLVGNIVARTVTIICSSAMLLHVWLFAIAAVVFGRSNEKTYQCYAWCRGPFFGCLQAITGSVWSYGTILSAILYCVC
jgi:hypothetical protein